MDRPVTRMDADARTQGIDLAEPDAYLPPSRQALLDLGCAALGLGPLLVTGDAGIGKTWAVARLTQLVPACRWAAVDLTPGDGPAELYRHIARGLGMGATAPTRLDVMDVLTERAADDERHALVIDEAHNLSPAVWEEVRVLGNRLGWPDGFVHLILVGQTSLVRRFATRSLAAIEARLAGHLHVRPLDLAEAGAWLARLHPNATFMSDDLEAIHRDSGGNPARLLRRFAALSARPAPRQAIEARPEVASPRAVVPLTEDGLAPAAVVTPPPAVAAPTHRPPLHVEENAIEVGWSTDEVAPVASDAEDEEAIAGGKDHSQAGLSDQAVHDHYAALQAWREWASNQEKRNPAARSDRDLADEIDEAAEAEAADQVEPVTPDRSQVRAEGHQHFAPFGQLFSRLSPAREANPPLL